MSSSYQNITFRADRASVADYLANLGVGAAVASSTYPSDFIVVYPHRVPGAPTAADWIAALLSAHFTRPVLLAEVHENETLRLRLFESGAPTDEYRTEPGFFSGEPLPPSGGDATRWCDAFGAPEAREELAELLRAGRYDDEHGFLFASERHRDIAELLGLPAHVVGMDDDSIPQAMASETGLELSFTAAHPERSLHEYVLLAAPPDAAEEEIAATLLPEVISLDLGLEKEEWQSRLGALADVQTTLESVWQVSPSGDTNPWLTKQTEGMRLDADLHAADDSPTACATVTLYVLANTEQYATLHPILQAAARATDGTVFDTATRRVLRFS